MVSNSNFVTMEEAIEKLEALCDRYDEPNIQDALNRLTVAQGSQDIEIWAKNLYLAKRSGTDENIESLNRDRKTILKLLYDVVKLWNKVYDQLGSDSADAFEEAIVDVFKIRRLERILGFGLPMDRAQALYAMKIPTSQLYGMHWYSDYHFDSSSPYCKYDYSEDMTVDEREEWRDLLDRATYTGEPTMNKKLYQLLYSEQLGLQRRHPNTFGRWSKPQKANFVDIRARNSSIGKDSKHMITVLFSAPLLYCDAEDGKYRPFATLEFDRERKLLQQSLEEAGRDIQLSFDTATHHRLLAAKAKGSSCLHYSGHGHISHLAFEDGKGGPHWLDVEVLKTLIEKEEGAPFKLVFVSACYSRIAGETFANAGVPHVVCCQQDSELLDTVAHEFTRQFYLALAIGLTVKESFQAGCNAVRGAPNLPNADEEMRKFQLLPEDGNHDIPIFVGARKVTEWQGSSQNHSELLVQNMMQEDPSPTPPQFFVGREIDMYYVFKSILSTRLVNVVGENGIGRSSIVRALCHYINERRSSIFEIDHIYYIQVRQSTGTNRLATVLHELLQKLVQDGTDEYQEYSDTDLEYLSTAIFQSFNKGRALLVIDQAELLIESDDAQGLILFLCNLFHQAMAENVRVLLTGKDTLGAPSVGGEPERLYHLGPLDFQSTVQLFSNLCPHLRTPADRREFIHRLVLEDQFQAELFPADRDLSSRTRSLLSALGNGVPSQVAKAAFSISRSSFERLGVDEVATFP